jgi:hypothetical protein
VGLRDRIAKLELYGGRCDGLLILVEGGLPDQPPITAEAKAKAHAELRLMRNGIIVLGGLPKCDEP